MQPSTLRSTRAAVHFPLCAASLFASSSSLLRLIPIHCLFDLADPSDDAVDSALASLPGNVCALTFTERDGLPTSAMVRVLVHPKLMRLRVLRIAGPDAPESDLSDDEDDAADSEAALVAAIVALSHLHTLIISTRLCFSEALGGLSACAGLTSLQLSEGAPPSVSFLKPLRQLTHLDLRGFFTTDAAWTTLFQFALDPSQLRSLRSLVMRHVVIQSWNARCVSDAVMQRTFESLTQLRSLTLMLAFGIDDILPALTHAGCCPQLECLTIDTACAHNETASARMRPSWPLLLALLEAHPALLCRQVLTHHRKSETRDRFIAETRENLSQADSGIRSRFLLIAD